MTSPVQSVPSDTTIFQVSQLMADKNIGSVLVTQDNEYIGIVTERDLTQKVIGKNLNPQSTQVTEVMSSPLITMDGNEPVTTANQFMAKNKIRHLAVTEKGKIIGILSVKDLVAFFANPRLRH